MWLWLHLQYTCKRIQINFSNKIRKSNLRSKSGVDNYDDKIEIFVHENDIVPRASLGTMELLIKSANALQELGLTYMKTISTLFDGDGNKDALEKISQTLKQVESQHIEKFEHPGKVYFLKNYGDHFKILSVDGRYFSDKFPMIGRYVQDHKRNSYEKAFSNVRL